MAQVTRTLGAPNTVNAGRVDWQPSPTLEIDAMLASGRGGLSRFSFSNTFQVFVRTGTASGSNIGPELLSSWESFATAVIIRAPTLNDLILPGPNAPGVASRDTSEPYTYRLSQSQFLAAYSGASAQNWLTAFAALTGPQQAATTITLRDQLPAVNQTGSGTALKARGSLRDATGRKKAPLALADFALPAETTLVCAALIAAGANAQSGGIALYSAPAHQAADSGSLLDGDLIYAPDE